MTLDVIGFGALNLDRLFQVNQIACKDEEGYIENLIESCGICCQYHHRPVQIRTGNRIDR